jgi:heme/copper-type cytochrome/quinol oxidase subunit 3
VVHLADDVRADLLERHHGHGRRRGQVADWKKVANMVLATAGGGVSFLAMQAYEWGSLIRDGVTLG